MIGFDQACRRGGLRLARKGRLLQFTHAGVTDPQLRRGLRLGDLLALPMFPDLGKGQTPWFDCSMTMAMNQHCADGLLANVPPSCRHEGC
jgi:hypothetical protein